MKKNERIIYITIILALLLITFIQHNAIRKARQARDKEFSEFNQRVEDKEKQIDSARVLINTIAFKSRQEREVQEKVISRLQTTNVQLRARKVPLVTNLAPAIQADSGFQAFKANTDSIIFYQDSTLVATELLYKAQIRSLTDIIALEQIKFSTQKDITDLTTGQLEQTQEKLKKTERKLKRQKAFTRIVGGVAFALSLGLIATSQ